MKSIQEYALQAAADTFSHGIKTDLMPKLAGMAVDHFIQSLPHRVIHCGHRRFESGMIAGLVVQSGSRVERLTPTGQWVLVDVMHPADASDYVAKRSMHVAALDHLSTQLDPTRYQSPEEYRVSLERILSATPVRS